MQAHKIEPVEVIILERSQQPQIPSPSTESPLQGTILFYDDPFELAVPVKAWEALQ